MSAYIGLNGVTNTILNYITSNISIPSGSVTNKLSSTLHVMTGAGTSFSLPAASTLFGGWNITIKNASSGVVTIIAPANSLDGVTNFILNRNDMVQIACDGTAFYNIVSKYTYATTRDLFTFGATNIVDGQPSFSRTNILSSTSGLNFADNDSSFIQCILPPDFVISSPVTFTIVYVPTSVTVGNFEWYLYAAALEGTDAITTAPTPPSTSGGNWTGTSLIQASNAVINSRQSLSFTVPLFGLAAGKTLLLKLLNTASPGATNPLILAASATYQAYQDFGF